MYGSDFDPIMQMSKNCIEQQRAADKALEERKPIENKMNAVQLSEAAEFTVNLLKPINDQWEKVAQFTHPKLKAIEVQMDNTDPFKDVSKDELILRLRLLEKLAEASVIRDGGDQGGAGEEGEI